MCSDKIYGFRVKIQLWQSEVKITFRSDCLIGVI